MIVTGNGPGAAALNWMPVWHRPNSGLPAEEVARQFVRNLRLGLQPSRGKAKRREGASGKWVAHWKTVHIVRPVWEDVGEANQMGRAFPPLSYTAADAASLTELEPAPRTIRGARDLLSVALQYGNAFGQGFQAAALKATASFGNARVRQLMEDMAPGGLPPPPSPGQPGGSLNTARNFLNAAKTM